MALFKEKISEHSHSTVVSEGARVKGELNLECSLFFDGQLEGKVISSSEITIGENAKVEGAIKAKSVVIFGEFVGEVDAELVEIKEGGKLKGKVNSCEFVIEPKAIFEGESHCKGESQRAVDV